MPREQEDEREDDDESKSKRPPQLVLPALAGLTSIVASTPLLSVSPKNENVEDTEKEEAHERKVIRIPGDDSVIIPLHGDSDEEINPERYTDPSLVKTEATDEPSVKAKPGRTKGRTKEKTMKSKAETKPERSEKKPVVQALAGLATVIGASPMISAKAGDEDRPASPIITEPSDKPEQPSRDESCERKFIKNTKEDNVIVPLHGDSDEQLHPDRYSDPSLVTTQRVDGPVIEEYPSPSPRISHTNGRVVQKENLPSKIELAEDEPDNFKLITGRRSPSPKTSALSKLFTPELAGMTTLLAASPLLVTSENERLKELEDNEGKEAEPEKQMQERKFIRIPNDDNNIIIPLHGDSDEELNPERYEDPSLLGVQRIGGGVVEEIKAEKTAATESKTSEPAKKSSKKKEKPSSLAKMVTPVLAGMTTLLAASPILSVSPKNDGSTEEEVKEHDEDVPQDAKPIERKYIKTANSNDVIIPLHGDSDEEIHPERYKDETMVGFQKIDGPTVEVIKHHTPDKASKDEKKGSKRISKKDSKKVKDQAPKVATPLLAGMTTLLAASPILSVSPKIEKEEDDTSEQTIGQIDENTQPSAAYEQPLERKYISIPNQDGIIIPLHGDSDEELHPERYEDPAWIGVQKIEGPTLESGTPLQLANSDKSKALKAIDVKKVAQKAKDQVAKVATPFLAGMTTLLAASPILTVSPKKDESVTVEEGHGKNKDIPQGSHDSEAKVEEQNLTAVSEHVEGPNEMPEEKTEEKPLERKVISIPNRDGVIIPLHGESDEEMHPERYEDPSRVVIQKIDGPSGVEMPKKIVGKENSKSGRAENIKKAAKEAKKQVAKVATPLLAGMTTLLAASPILTVSPKQDEHHEGLEDSPNEETSSEVTKDETGTNQEDNPIERKVIVIPEKEGFIIPLHGDSDEELHPERYQDPSMITIQKIEGPTLEMVKPPPTKTQEKEKGLFKSFKIKDSSKKAKDQTTKVATPLLAGMTTLLAASPILTVSPKASEHGDDLDKDKVDIEEGVDDAIENTNDEQPLERKIIKVPNKEGFIIPLHGDSDEELHPERYEDPSMVSIQRIEGPTPEPIISPPKDQGKKKKKLELNIKEASKNVKEKATNVVTPLLAGLTTILAASPILTAAPKKKSEPEQKREEKKVDIVQNTETVSGEVEAATVDSQAIEIAEEQPESLRDVDESSWLKTQNVEVDYEPIMNASAQGDKDIGSVAEEEAPLPKARKQKRTLESSIAETIEITKPNEVKEPLADEFPTARENEYEPINPPELPPSPSAQGRLSRRDQAEIETTQEQPPVEIHTSEVKLKRELVTNEIQASSADPEHPSRDVQEISKQQELAGLLAASPIVFKPPPVQEKEDEIRSEEVLERKFIRIPDDNKSIIIPLHGDSDEDIHPERYKDPSLQGVQRIEGPVLEDLKPPPKPPRDIASQSEYEPIQKPSEMGVDEDRPHLSLQDRFKAGAGQMRDKFRNMQVPKINLPDRPQMKLPERPQFLKERPQFLKERPKFLKERPQFLKERPQFLKERPQFLKERPQFLKEKPKFLTERPKFLSERPKFHLPDRSNFKFPERFRMEKKSPKLDKPKIRRPNPSSLRRPLRDAITISSSSSHNLFETLKARTYPRFLSKKKRDRERAAQLRQQASFETESSQPSSPPDRRKLFPEKHRDIKFVDEEPGYNDQRMDVQSEEGYEENTAPFHERYLSTPEQKKMETMRAKIDSSSDIAESDKEQISSGSGSTKHRAGVLEEIDSDEFFLRQKGLSREDVDVSRYLSKEIREAFRSPKNALVQMDSTERYTDEYEDEEEEEDLRYLEETAPQPPERRSARSNRSFTGSRDSDFNTFPTRPTRRKQSEPEVGSRDIFEKVRKPPRKNRSRSGTRNSLRSLDRFSRRSATEDVPQPPSRQKSLRSLNRSRPQSESDAGGGSALGDVAQEDGMAPIRPLRKSQSRGASVDERTSRGADSLPQDYGDYEPEEEEIEVDEEEIGDEEIEDEQEQRAREHVHVFHAVPITTSVPVRSESLDEEIPGYAVVRKPKPPRPPLPRRSRKEQLQSQLHTIKAHGITFFQTFPRRAMKSLNKPRLPVRSLKTPVRPPRRNRVFREPVYVDGDLPGEQPSSSTFKENTDLKHEYEEARDLQSGEIVERMKGRPLPAPPRPPRKTKDDESVSEVGEEDLDVPEDINTDELVLRTRLNILGTPEGVMVEESIVTEDHSPTFIQQRRMPSTVDTSQQTSFELVETSVSIQTDPLPYGMAIENQRDASSRTIVPEEHASRNRLVEELMQRNENTRDVPSAEDPRRLFDPRVVHESEEATREETPPPLPQRNIPPPPIPVIPPVQVSFPDKLHLTQLDVDKLNVNELQANIIKVSEIDGVTMQVSEITGKSGNLVLNGIELPPDFIKNLVAQIPIPKPPEAPKPVEIPERVREKPVEIPERVRERPVEIVERVRETTPQPHLKRILTPPPPIVVQHTAQLASEAPSPPILQASTTEQLSKPVTTRTRRKSPTRVVDDSEEELASVILERERRERERLDRDVPSKKGSKPQDAEKKPDQSAKAPPSISTEEPSTSQDGPSTADGEATSQQIQHSSSDDQTINQASAFKLIKQLVAIWYRDLVSGSASFIQGINSIFPENDKRRDAQTAALILVIMIASLIILGLGAEQSVHHHHWDYLNPPR